MEYLFKNDWREKIAAMTEADDLDIEKTFSDIASGFVANKVGDLMKDQHRIGFEIVKKNEDNTRMLGVFAFKVDKELIFAPVFFLSGEIKGPLLYRCDTKQFLPANKEWASYLIESIETTEGRGVNRSKLGDTSPMVDMDKIMTRPKQASTLADEDLLKEAIKLVKENGGDQLQAEQFDELVNKTYDKLVNERLNIKRAFTNEFGEDVEAGLLESIRKSASFQPGILKQFLSEEGYGLMAVQAIEKAAALDESGRLAEHLVSLYGSPSNLIPDNISDFKKEASEVRNLEVHFEFTKQAAQNANQYFKDGFFMFDQRYKHECTKVTKNPLHSSLTSVVDCGTYDVLKQDGQLIKDVFCANIYDASKCCSKRYSDICYPSQLSGMLIAIDSNGDIAIQNKILGVPKLNYVLDAGKDKLPGTDDIQQGNVYVAHVDGADSVTSPFYVSKVSSKDGVKFCNVKFINDYSIKRPNQDEAYTYVYPDDLCNIIVNKDASSNVEKGVFGKDAKFIKINATVSQDDYSSLSKKIKIKKLTNLADSDNADVWVFDKFNAPTAELQFDKSASHPFTLIDLSNGEQSQGMNTFQIMTKLASNLDIHAEDAYDIVNTAQQNGSCVFTMNDITKAASQIHIVGRPRFTEEFDGRTGIPVSEKQTFVLNTAGIQQFDERPHVGDAMNPTTATGLPNLTVVTTAPEQLRDLAETYNLPNVFEHGAVGALADTFDANTLVNKYVDKLQEAVDSLGRTKFLFYWKPDDFQKAYGSDDMINLEAEIDSNFESLGNLTLKLRKKSDKQHKYSAKTDNKLD